MARLKSMARLYVGLSVEFVIFPIRYIVLDVIGYSVHIIGVSNDVVMKTGLPRKR